MFSFIRIGLGKYRKSSIKCIVPRPATERDFFFANMCYKEGFYTVTISFVGQLHDVEEIVPITEFNKIRNRLR